MHFFVNKGDIKVENFSGSYILLGGITGHSNAGGLYGCTLLNEGDITVRNATFTTPASACVGGIVGNATFAISGAKCYCNIDAVGCPRVGMFTGAAYDPEEPFAKSCEFSCRIADGSEVREEADGSLNIVPTWANVDATNFQNYIYGGTTTWPEGSDYNGCTFVTPVM